MTTTLLAILAAMQVEAAPVRRPVVEPPDWAVRPSAEEIGRALESVGIRVAPDVVRVTLRCRVTVEGLAEDCVVRSNESPDARYGEAALRVSRSFRFHPRRVDGVATGDGVIVVPVRLTFVTWPPASAAPSYRRRSGQ